MNDSQGNLLIYKSSAGSGKTTRLVFEYLNLILPQPKKYKHILAITFTNKAANEMKQRIIEYLGQIANPDPEAEIKKFDQYSLLVQKMDEHGYTISEQAEKCLTLILHSYSDFAVSTIDSFVHKIIRTFAKDLQIPWDFDVEIDTADIYRQIIDMLLEEFGKDQFMSKQLFQLVSEKLNEGKSWKFEKDILDLSKSILEYEQDEPIENMLQIEKLDIEKLRKELQSDNAQLIQKAETIAKQALTLIESHGLKSSDFSNKNAGFAGYLEKIAAQKNREKVFEGNKNAAKAFEKQQLYPQKAPREIQQKIDEIHDQLYTAYEKLEQIRQQSQEYFSRKAIAQNLYILAILKSIKEIYEDIKKEHTILPISEFARSIAKITLNEDIPFIYERLGEKYQHFFIDEFQDTSTLQWENLLPLVDNSLAYNNFNLIVGDVKQAIYRFRGGNIEQLANMPYPPPQLSSQKSLQRYQTIRQQAHTVPLDNNFRSAKEIIDFNNDFFEFAQSWLDEEQQSYYSELKQHPNPGNIKTGGLVQVQLDDREEHPGITFDIIQSLLDEGYQQKEITVLCRKNKEAQDLAVFLLGQTTKNNKKLKVISDESLTLKQSTEVNTLISVARLMENPENTAEIANVLYYFFEKNRPEESFHLWTKKMLKKASYSFHGVIKNLSPDLSINDLQYSDLYNFFELIAIHFGLNTLNNPYLQFFFDEVFNFIESHKIPGLHEFLVWWDDKGKNKSIIAPEGSDAIQIKTVHKAKGLAFQIVIYPFATEEAFLSQRKNYKWVDLEGYAKYNIHKSIININTKSNQDSIFKEERAKEQNASTLDMLNILYVCMTRPRKRLYILSSIPKADHSDNALHSLSDLFFAYFQKKGITEDIMQYPEKPKPHQATTKTESSEEDVTLQINYERDSHWKKKISVALPETRFNVDSSIYSNTKGNMLHYYLSLIYYHDDWQGVKEKIEKEIKEQSNQEYLISAIENIMFHDETRQYFDKSKIKSIFNEKEILQGNQIHRPDRIVLFDDHITLIDYKTGKFLPTHETQLNNYSKSLSQMYELPQTKLLVYVDHDIHIHRVMS
ncbi:MAG: UvrD-helicase domain-containing protein [Bacteroidota bacterium]